MIQAEVAGRAGIGVNTTSSLEAMQIARKSLLALGVEEAELSPQKAAEVIDNICHVANGFTSMAEHLLPGRITQDTLCTIQGRIDDNIRSLR